MRNRIKSWLIKFKENLIEKILLVLLLPGQSQHSYHMITQTTLPQHDMFCFKFFRPFVIIFMRLRYGYLTFHYEIYLTTLVVRSFYHLGQYIGHHLLHETVTELDLLLLVLSQSRYYLNKYSDWTFRKKRENDSRTVLNIGKCRMKKMGQWLYVDFDSMNSK